MPPRVLPCLGEASLQPLVVGPSPSLSPFLASHQEAHQAQEPLMVFVEVDVVDCNRQVAPKYFRPSTFVKFRISGCAVAAAPLPYYRNTRYHPEGSRAPTTVHYDVRLTFTTEQ